MTETYILSWSKMLRLSEGSPDDIPRFSGIYRIWSSIGQCLYVGSAVDLRLGVAGFISNCGPLRDERERPRGCQRLYVDWASVDGVRRQKLQIYEARRLKPKWIRLT